MYICTYMYIHITICIGCLFCKHLYYYYYYHYYISGVYYYYYYHMYCYLHIGCLLLLSLSHILLLTYRVSYYIILC